VNTSFVARLDEELDIGVHERHGHRNITAIRENKLGVIAEFLDKTEDVVLVRQFLIQGERGKKLPIDRNSIRKNDLSIHK
jgi:hypothetical protein